MMLISAPLVLHLDLFSKQTCYDNTYVTNVSALTDSHEAIFSLALLQCVFNDAAQFEEEQLLRRFGGGARAFGLTILFTQRLGTGVT